MWEPPSRLVFEWRGQNFGPDERTEVEVRFESRQGGTQVTLEHRGWAAFPEDHPARRGGQTFCDMLGLWWGDLLTSYRANLRERV